jgi:uncharacterized protein (DUF433 family)
VIKTIGLLKRRPGMTVAEFRDVFPMNHDHNVAGVLRYIAERLREEAETDFDSSPRDVVSVDWRECSGIELDTSGRTPEWVFEGTHRSVAGLFEHLGDGGSTTEYRMRFPEVPPASITAVLEHLVTCLDTE